MRRGYLTPPVLIGLAIICLVTAATIFFNTFLIRNAKNEPIATPSPTDASPAPNDAGETTNWKTFVSSSCGFSLQAPNVFKGKDKSVLKVEDPSASDIDSVCLSLLAPDYAGYLGEPNGGLAIHVHRYLIGSENNGIVIRTISDYVESVEKKGLPVSGQVNKRYGNIDGVYFVSSGAYFPEANFTSTQQDYLYNISWNSDYDGDYKKYTDQILSTFKFLDQPADGEFCGGIAGIQCPSGFECALDGNYPDAGGKCVKN